MQEFSPTYCPQCGAASFACKQGTCYVCTSCQFEYFHNTAAAVAGLIECNGEYLLTRRAKEPGKNSLDLPGGFIDPKESLEQGLSREVFEELGIHVEHWQYFASAPNQYLYKNVRYNTLDTLFGCSLSQKPTLQLEQAEILEAVWVSRDDFDPQILFFDSLKRLAKQYLAAN
ncbi:NUDIX domain-containing protein [Neiella marina]|uniref:NUDIX domain-containing protein n=1 Tax=Neiella holothuriorum TaxID=2870530 RepID=A0ABS7EBN9_9GAMM|nr:NUDIX domain-containing protein [Neiella holothuriorum]MBW8189745.1 NUDIX domain-containing protein [Neiella holothuriorum]